MGAVGSGVSDRQAPQLAGALSNQQANQPMTNGRILARMRGSMRSLRRHTQTRLPSLSNRDVLMLFFNTVSGPKVPLV